MIQELRDLVLRMEKVSQQTYWLFFGSGMGTDVHAFLEFNGLIAKYVDICRKAAEKDIDFRVLNVHSGQALPVEEHDIKYMAEKLRCIFGPIIDSNPKIKEIFLKELLDGSA